MIVARGLGQTRVLGVIAAFGLGIGGAADVIVEPKPGGGYIHDFRRPLKNDDNEVVLLIGALVTTGALDET